MANVKRTCYTAAPVTTRRDIIAAVRAEFGRHKFDTFVIDPPSIAQGGRGIVVPGCISMQIADGN